MAVIVSDFEIITDTSDGEDESSDAAERPASGAAMRPIDVENVVERDRRRRHRLRAH